MTPPQSDSSSLSADDFAVHFSSKIDKICASTASAPSPKINARSADAAPLSSFRTVDATEIKCLLSRIPAKHCQLDPVPTWLVKRVATVLAPVLNRMCNASLRSGIFPDSHKDAVVFPRLKKPSLDPDDANSYRPISNLSFVSLNELLQAVISIMLNRTNCFLSNSLHSGDITVLSRLY
jgi:hypothetical protein